MISLTYDQKKKKKGRYQPIYCNNNNMVIFTGLEHICLDSVFNERLDNIKGQYIISSYIGSSFKVLLRAAMTIFSISVTVISLQFYKIPGTDSLSYLIK